MKKILFYYYQLLEILTFLRLLLMLQSFDEVPVELVHQFADALLHQVAAAPDAIQVVAGIPSPGLATIIIIIISCCWGS